MTWLEALPPLVIVAAGIAGMGALQGVAHRAYYGRVSRPIFFAPSACAPNLNLTFRSSFAAQEGAEGPLQPLDGQARRPH